MNGKGMILLVLAVVCGLGAMYGTSKLLSKETGPKAVAELQDVLVAIRDLKTEEELKPEMTKVLQMSKANVPAGSYTAFQDVQDRWVQIKILEGEPIIDRKLAPKGSPPGLVSRIPKGMRAFTIEVNENTGVAGFILPDHRVDVVQVEPGKNNNDAEAETVLEDVLVLASGQVFSRPEDRSIASRTVTLAVTPDQVDILVAARTKGALSLALRGLNDHLSTKRIKPPPVEEKKIVVVANPVEVPLPPPAPPAPPEPLKIQYVTVHHGLRNPERVHLDGRDEEMSEIDFEGLAKRSND